MEKINRINMKFIGKILGLIIVVASGLMTMAVTIGWIIDNEIVAGSVHFWLATLSCCIIFAVAFTAMLSQFNPPQPEENLMHERIGI
jgi:biotin transporter BioY